MSRLRIVCIALALGAALATVAPAIGQQVTSIATIPSRNTVTRNSLGASDPTTVHDGLVLKNITPGTLGTTVQVSPNLSLIGHAWHTADAQDWEHRFVMALEPATIDYTANIPLGSNVIPGGTLRFHAQVVGHDSSPREIMRLQQNGNILAASSIDAGMGYDFDPDGTSQLGDLSAAPPSGIYWRKMSTDSSTGSPTTRATMASSAPGLWQLFAFGTASAKSVELNTGVTTPSIASACGTNPSISSNSNNTHGSVTIGTGGTATACLLDFGAPAWTNAPHCFASMDTTTAGNVRAMAAQTSTTQVQFTAATAWVAGTTFNYFCVGRAS